MTEAGGAKCFTYCGGGGGGAATMGGGGGYGMTTHRGCGMWWCGCGWAWPCPCGCGGPCTWGCGCGAAAAAGASGVAAAICITSAAAAAVRSKEKEERGGFAFVWRLASFLENQVVGCLYLDIEDKPVMPLIQHRLKMPYKTEVHEIAISSSLKKRKVLFNTTVPSLPLDKMHLPPYRANPHQT